ncbi:MAG: transketolase family protein [Actinobacteria bacterium]|nr:transketolase family protein [Actinomycetota bacterium]
MEGTRSTRDAYGEVLVSLGVENPKIVVVDADVSKATRTSLFARQFPERFFNVGVAEQNLMGVAAGLSLTGLIPIASTFAVFATGRAFDQVRNTIAYGNCNVKIVATHGGITVGEDGASHQSIEDIALMRVLPNMKVIVPADAFEVEKALRAAVRIYGPVYIRLGRVPVPTVTSKCSHFEIGRANVLRDGSDLAILATGIMVSESLKAAEILSSEGVESAVINVHTIKPLDRETVLETAKRCGALITAEEHSIVGGLGSAVAELLSTECWVALGMVGVKDTFGESGSPKELMKKYGITAGDIVEKAKEVLNKKKTGRAVCR